MALLSPIPLMFGMAYDWELTVVMAVVALTLVAYGLIRAFLFNPNAGDPEQRKLLGQKHAVWGEPLNELLATSPHVIQPTDPETDGKPKVK